MRKIIVTGFLSLLVLNGFGQIPEAEKLRNDALARLDSLRRNIDSTLNPRSLEGLLARKFPKDSRVDGRWFFMRTRPIFSHW